MASRFSHYLTLWFPGWQHLVNYRQSWLKGDLLAGVTVAAYLIPQCMAYGSLAGVEPVVGLWAILPPMLIYALLGSSPQLSIGPESTTAVMTAAAIGPLVAQQGGDYAALASLLAVMVGGICLIGYVARLGFLSNLLSKPILVGYMAGVALIMVGGQLKKVTGIPVQANDFLGQVEQVMTHWQQLHPPTFFLALGVLFFLFGIQHYFPTAPGPLLAVLASTAMVRGFALEQQGIAVVGDIPAGLPHFTWPTGFSSQHLIYLASAAIGIAVVGYSDNVLTARAFAARNRYTIDTNQELLALGAANLGAGMMQGFPISGSGSRTVIGDSLGSKSQVCSLVAFVIVILVLLFLRPLLASFPLAALGAIVVYAALRLIDLSEFRRLRRFRSSELLLAVLTTTGVLLTNILLGVGIAVGLSVIDLLARLSHPHDAVLGKVPDLPGLHDIKDWQGAETIPGLVLYRYDAPLCFANAEDFKQRALAAIAAERYPVQWFILNSEAIVEIDITAMDILEALRQELADRQITFGMARVKQDLYVNLKKVGLADRIGRHYIFPTLPTVIAEFQKYQSALADQAAQA
ncbi:MAG: solute carrier family 26 protein [Leptolyngbyaceae cyanobacterium]